MTASTITRPRRWLRRPDTGGTGGGRDGNALIGQSKATPYLFSLPAIILVAGTLYFVSVLFGRVGGVLRQALPRRHLEA